MADLVGALIGQAIGVLLWSFLMAAVLRKQALRRRKWEIRYGDAYFVSLKAGFTSMAFADLASFAAAFLSTQNEDLVKSVGMLFGITAWWYAHSSALLKLSGPQSSLSINDARAISNRVFVLVFGCIFLVGMAILIFALAYSAIRGSPNV